MKMRVAVRDLARQGIFAAVMAVCAWISIPFGSTPFTLQTFALFLALFTLGGRGGTVACLVYLVLGAVGLPVFSGFRGGLGAILGPTGGFLWGLAAAGLIYWLCTRIWGEKAGLWSAFLGMAVCYFLGTAWYVTAYAKDAGWWAGFLACVVPYIIPDVLKILLARQLARRLVRIEKPSRT